ncbi:MAG: hypothetical protein M1827_004858 [Pycnora praestabilis]|nr:MAG: hypothetical protein M1827_004858 [Pycnora praestabilis]
MASKAVIPFLVAMMLVTGVCNTLLTKYQDLQCVRNCDDHDSEKQKHFEQPVIQTLQMFIGEAGCWVVVAGFAVYKRYFSLSPDSTGYEPVGTIDADSEPTIDPITAQDGASPAAKPLVSSTSNDGDDARRELVGWRVILLALPACCDITGTTLMNVGLLFVAASIYQMTRGALVLFVGLFSVIFLRRRLGLYQWSALFIVVLGVAIVGLAGAIAKNPQALPKDPGPLRDEVMEMAKMILRAVQEEIGARVRTTEAVKTIIGVFLIAGAQIFTATQFVLEEWILEQYALEPLKVVGWEGIFGLVVTVIGMIILHFAVGRTHAGPRWEWFDMVEGWREVSHNSSIWVSSLLIMISIG